MAQISGPWPHRDGDPDFPFEAIGRMTVAYADMELALNWFVWKLIDQRTFSTGSAVTTNIDGVGRILQLGRNLLDVADLNLAQRDEARTLFEELKQANRQRNAVTHSTWFLGSVDGQMRVMHASVRDMKSVARPSTTMFESLNEMDEEDILQLRDVLLDLTERLGRFISNTPGIGHGVA